jgi:hypothetical protein
MRSTATYAAAVAEPAETVAGSNVRSYRASATARPPSS